MAKLSSDAYLSLRRRYRTQKSLRSPLNALWDDIDYYTGPVKESGSTAQNPQGGTGSNLEARTDLWDFTAIEGREKLTASIFGSAMGSAYRFFFFAARTPEVQKDNESAKWLSDESEAVWNDIQDSDFNTEMPASLHELCGPGNCFLAMVNWMRSARLASTSACSSRSTSIPARTAARSSTKSILSKPPAASRSQWPSASNNRRRRPPMNDHRTLHTLTAAVAATYNGADQHNPSGFGIHVTVDITNITGTLTVTIQGKDPASGKYYTLLASAPLAAVATTVLKVFPGATVAANLAANDILPDTFRVIAVSATGPVTATIGCSIVD
jgi:hypothetical protein